MRTAISLSDSLFNTVETIRKSQHLKRSTFFSLAIQNYIKHLKNKKLLNSLNEIYSNEINNENMFIKNTKNYVAKNILEKEEW